MIPSILNSHEGLPGCLFMCLSFVIDALIYVANTSERDENLCMYTVYQNKICNILTHARLFSSFSIMVTAYC